VIRLAGVAKRYASGALAVDALRGVDLEIGANEYVAVTGPSGSGKSTLMNILGCLDRPSTGTYHLKDLDISGCDGAQLAAIRNREIGFIFQSFQLAPRATALQNVAQPMVYRGTPRALREERARHMLERVGLGERVHHRPPELSGGQRQRVAIARALVGEPSVVLADEPTGNLDAASSREVLAMLEELHAGGMTIVVVTHDEEVARRCHRRIRVRDGTVVA